MAWVWSRMVGHNAGDDPAMTYQLYQASYYWVWREPDPTHWYLTCARQVHDSRGSVSPQQLSRHLWHYSPSSFDWDSCHSHQLHLHDHGLNVHALAAPLSADSLHFHRSFLEAEVAVADFSAA